MATIKQKSAWSLVQIAFRDGMLVRKSCKCGKRGFTLAHHNNYDKPLDVEFKCYGCHRKTHHLEHLAFTNQYPEYYESDTEKSVLIETTWDECMRMLETKDSIKATPQTRRKRNEQNR